MRRSEPVTRGTDEQSAMPVDVVVVPRGAVEAEELLEHEGVLVGRALDVGGDAPVVDQARVGQAPVDVGVDAVRGRRARPRSGCCRRRGRGARRQTLRGFRPRGRTGSRQRMSRPMSRAGADWVIWLELSRSTPLARVGAGRLDGDAAAALEQRPAAAVGGGPVVDQVDGRLGLLRRHVVEQHRVGAGLERLRELRRGRWPRRARAGPARWPWPTPPPRRSRARRGGCP